MNTLVTSTSSRTSRQVRVGDANIRLALQATFRSAVQGGASQEKLVRYQKENGILGIDEKQNIVTSKLDEFNRELTAAEADRIQKESSTA